MAGRETGARRRELCSTRILNSVNEIFYLRAAVLPLLPPRTRHAAYNRRCVAVCRTSSGGKRNRKGRQDFITGRLMQPKCAAIEAAD